LGANARAQAFCRRHSFGHDRGTVHVDQLDVDEVRMVRGAAYEGRRGLDGWVPGASVAMPTSIHRRIKADVVTLR
jgi:hypothetical protein